MDAPVIFFLLGDTATFRLRMENEKHLRSWRLHLGDVVALGGELRRAFRSIDRIFPSISGMLGKRAGALILPCGESATLPQTLKRRDAFRIDY